MMRLTQIQVVTQRMSRVWRAVEWLVRFTCDKVINKRLKVPSVNQDIIVQSFHCLWNVAEEVIGLSRLNVHETGCCVVLRHVLVCPGKDRGFGIGSPQPGIAYGDRD